MEAVLDIVRLIGPEFSDTADSVILNWINLCKPLVSKKVFGDLYEQALAYMVCHRIKLAGGGASTYGEHGTIGDAFGGVGSVSDGGSSISFNTSGALNGMADSEYSLTLYGTQFLHLRQLVVVPIHIAGELDNAILR